MNNSESGRMLETAVAAALAAGQIMRRNFHATKKVTTATQHDIKLELDVRCQKRIERILRQAWGTVPILGEEGIVGNPEAPSRWVVDPIDGTVNFSYGIPHACVSIALQVGEAPAPAPSTSSGQVASKGPALSLSKGLRKRAKGARARATKTSAAGGPPARAANGGSFRSVLGVVYDPFCDELWTAVQGEPARLNGNRIQVSDRKKMDEAVVAIGFAKESTTLDRMLPTFNHLIHRVRKIRIMGSAALALAYVATGRMDAYVEYGLRLWDIAAGGLLVECAGGNFWSQPIAGEYAYQILASNNRLADGLKEICAAGPKGRAS